MSKYTKGPWKAQGNLIFSAEHKSIARLFALPREIGESTAKEESANARLIASAPELLEFAKHVLKEQLEHGEHGDAENIRFAFEVIAKAEGDEK